MRIALIILALFAVSACDRGEPKVDPSPPDIRRLTEQQYRNIIADVFGSTITVSGRFDPLVRTEGLLAMAAWSSSVTPAGFAQYEDMARNIAAQIVNPPHSDILVPCSLDAFDEACTRTFLSKTGRLLFRRPLSDAELNAQVDRVKGAMSALGGFRDALAFGVAGLLVAPDFLFVIDVAERQGDGWALNAFSKASRLSLLLWNSAPDERLLAAAERGELDAEDGIARQVERMMASPRLKTGVRAFFADMLGFNGFDTLEKDSVIYPAFGLAASQSAREQALRTIAHHVVTEDRDYRDLFTTRTTFLNRALGRIYRVQVTAPDGGWQQVELPAGDPRAGIQSQPGFLALYSHPGRGSPTLRGKAVRTMLLCQKVPDPPSDVDFSQFNDPNSPARTARERLSAHSTNPACAGCHRITDPIGLALEHFDGAGQFRQTENQVAIDASGDLDGIAFQDAAGLAQALRNNPAATACVVNRLTSYATGRTRPTTDPWSAYLNERFADDGYRLKGLLGRIATSAAFLATKGPEAKNASAGGF